MFYHTTSGRAVLDDEVYSNMSRKKSTAVLEGSDHVPKDAYVMLGGITLLVELRRVISEALDKAFDKHFGQKPENPEEMKATGQRSAGPEHNPRQRRLVVEPDITQDNKTRKRMEDAAADLIISKDSFSAKVDPDTMCLTSFKAGDKVFFSDNYQMNLTARR